MRLVLGLCLLHSLAAPQGASRAPDRGKDDKIDLKKGLAGHWPLAGDTRDQSGNGNHATNHGADLKAAGPDGKPGGAAGFNGIGAFLEVPAGTALKLGAGDFSIGMWMYSDREPEGSGDLVSRYDPARRRGFHLTLKTNAGVTFSQANVRQLQFGIDNNRESRWVDRGRPGKAVLAFALAVHDGQLYAGTCEPGKEAGRVYRHAGGQRWLDCGAPDRCNAVTALAVFNGRLYAGVGKYRLEGSALPGSENPHKGGAIYRYEGEKRWARCGRLPGAEAVAGLVVFRGRLHASSLYKPAGFFRYEGRGNWSDRGTPKGKRVEALGVYRGHLYATGYDEGHVYRYDGKAWTDLGRLGENTQTYAFAVYEGRLHVGTWPLGRVYRLEEGRWKDLGRLGKELEVMGMLVHNGRLIAGTLPAAEVYSYEGTGWRRLAQLDATPKVRYRRAWTMAEHDGQLFCSTLPSGRVFSYEAGKSATWDQELSPGWHHVAAIRRGGRCELYVDGRLVSRSADFTPADYDLDTDRPLRIGRGATDHFRGRLSDLRLYRRALSAVEVRELARPPKGPGR